MEERYWLHHPSLHSVVGPYRRKDLHAAIDSASFPRDSLVLLDRGQEEPTQAAAEDWLSVTSVLGLPAPPPAPNRVTPPRGAGEEDASMGRLWIVRQATAYATSRTLLNICAAIGILLAIVKMLVVLAAGRAPGEVALLAIGSTVIEIMIILVIAAGVGSLFDIADCSLRKDQRDAS